MPPRRGGMTRARAAARFSAADPRRRSMPATEVRARPANADAVHATRTKTRPKPMRLPRAIILLAPPSLGDERLESSQIVFVEFCRGLDEGGENRDRGL